MLLTKPGLMISTERMNHMEVDERNLIVRVQPGVITGHLQKEVEDMGLFYPVDPASLEMSSIGGNIAENAGGPRAFKYGVTRDFVLGLEVVLPDGEILELGGKTRKNVSGYSLKDLLIGSEGTLGTITGAYLKLLPLPKEKFLLWAVYEDIFRALEAMTKVYTSGLVPSAIEFVEKAAFQAVEKYTGLSIPYSDQQAHLLIEVDGFDREAVLNEAKAVSEILLKGAAKEVLVVPFENQQREVWNLRRKISEATKYLSYNKKSEDVVVPPDSIKDFLKDLKNVEKHYGVDIICFGHLGDGNVHVNILNTQDESGFIWEKFQDTMVEKVFELAMKYRGTLSGEHGIGITKRKYFRQYHSPTEIQIHRSIKKILDPKGLLNPGKIW
jgi:glycolate oxidase subunit GlcD